MTVIHSTASAQSRVATLNGITHEASIFGGRSGNRDASPARHRETALAVAQVSQWPTAGRRADLLVTHESAQVLTPIP